MTALTKDTNVFMLRDNNYARRSGTPGKAHFYVGQLLMLGLDDGLIKPLSASATGVSAIGAGVATRTDDLSVTGITTGSYYGQHIDYEEGTVTNVPVYVSDAVTAADVGNVVYGYDDNTIARTNGSSQRVKFGTLQALNTDGTAQVLVKRGLISSGSTR